MNKTSIQLYPKSRKPLYRHKNINERLLNKELNFFYSYCQKERRDNNKSFLSKYVHFPAALLTVFPVQLPVC